MAALRARSTTSVAHGGLVFALLTAPLYRSHVTRSCSFVPVPLALADICDASGVSAAAMGYRQADFDEVQRDVSIIIKHVSEFRADLLEDVLSSSACCVLRGVWKLLMRQR